MKKILFAITLLFISIINVNAEACDAYDIKRLKEIANGVEITYELQEPIQQEYGTINDVYKINIMGLTEELIVINEKDNKIYDINSDYSEIVLPGVKYYKIKSKNCSPILKSITLKLPVYNNYSNTKICEEKEYKSLNICQEWVEDVVTEKEFNDTIIETKKNSQQVEKKININSLITIGGILLVLILIIVIYVIYKRKREVLV